jgi:hypothetical protein
MQSESLNADIFKFLLLLGRPASGKSEFIDFMEKCPLERRMTRYHLGELHIIDDFVMLWEKFEEDDLWEKLGHRRLFSKRVGENYTVIDHRIWPFLIEKINVHAEKFIKATPNSLHRTVLIEFSRGGKTGYADALNTLSPEILSHTAILYIHVSPEESRRRNIARYDEKKKESILAHSVPHDEMERMYAVDDWLEIAPQPEGDLDINGVLVPYVTIKNEPESTDPNILDTRYREALDRLYTLWKENRP